MTLDGFFRGFNAISIKIFLNYIIFDFRQGWFFQKSLASGLFLTRPQVMSSRVTYCVKTKLGDKPMASTTNKQRPANVPEENVYTSLHWLMVAAYAASAVALFLLIKSAG